MDELKEAIEKIKEALREAGVPGIELIKPREVEGERYRYYNRAVYITNKAIKQLQEFKRSLYAEPEVQKKESKGYLLVVIEEKVPGFLGIDGKFYGPYKRGDVVVLPEETAEVLIKKGAARLIDYLF